MRGLDGLFAREIPNVKPGLTPLGGVVFYPRRFDLFAVSQTPSQSLVGLALLLRQAIALAIPCWTSLERSYDRFVLAPRQSELSCSLTRQLQHWDDAVRGAD